MAVKIRLKRVGKTKQASYRVVVADSRSPRDGRIIQAIGQYRPREEPSFVHIDPDAALAWLRKGAQPTEEVQKLLAIQGIWQTFESERGSPVDTKALRRTREMARAGVAPRGKKNPPPEPAPPAAPPAAAQAEVTEAPEPAEIPEAAETPEAEAAAGGSEEGAKSE